MKNAIVIGTAATYADNLATIEARNAYRASMTMESTGEARPYMAIGRDEPIEALTALWEALYGDVAEEANEADEADEADASEDVIASISREQIEALTALRAALYADEAGEADEADEAGEADEADEAIANEDVIAYIRRVGGADVAYSAPIGGTATESRTWYDALATDWEHVARIGILERYAFEPNLTVRDMARQDRAQGWINQNWRYGDHTMPIVWVGNPSNGVPMTVAPGRSGRGYERTGSRNWGNGAPIKNAETLAASIANGGQAVDMKTRKAAQIAARTPEQREIARVKDAARKAASRAKK